MSSSVALHLMYSGRVFHLNTELADELASKLAQGSYLCLWGLGVTGKPQVLRICIPGLTLYTAIISSTSTLSIYNLTRS